MKVTFPKFKSSDAELNKTYEYRAESYSKHVKKTPDGYVVTEFLPDVSWAGKYNTICCATMHHIMEGRWIHEHNVIEDYLRFWCDDEVMPREFTNRYSFALADIFMQYIKVSGNYSLATEEYESLRQLHHAWDFRVRDGLYSQACNYDGMEYSISGHGYRPTINSYMYGDKIALSHFAEYIGNTADAEKYSADAEILRQTLNERLWNEDIGMYGVISEDGIMQNVREPIGYIPWIYGIPEGRDECFKYLLDKNCFLAPYGIRTADASHPEYMKYYSHVCLWNGPVWPFATAQTLTALINYLHTESTPKITDRDFMSLLNTYSLSQREENGEPYIDENIHPDTGIWLARDLIKKSGRTDTERGREYNHSTFIDLVLTGVCGIVPTTDSHLTVAPLGLSLDGFEAFDINYHGRNLEVKYDKGIGLSVRVDGREYFKKSVGNVKIEIEI